MITCCWCIQSGDEVLRTNDQYLSLTDQLNLGVRAVELDTHWVEVSACNFAFAPVEHLLAYMPSLPRASMLRMSHGLWRVTPGGIVSEISACVLARAQGKLRIAHCGGFHAAPFNVLVRAVNLVATLLGHPIHWDTETVGCDPSLSSLPVLDQRGFADALAELAAWLGAPGNEQEFLVLFLDDQADIKSWVRNLYMSIMSLRLLNILEHHLLCRRRVTGQAGGLHARRATASRPSCLARLPSLANPGAEHAWTARACQGYLPILLTEIRATFPPGAVYTPPEHAAYAGSGSNSSLRWPSMNQLVAAGKRLIVASGEDYGPDMDPLLFRRSDICGWQARLRYAGQCLLQSPHRRYGSELTVTSPCTLPHGKTSSQDMQGGRRGAIPVCNVKTRLWCPGHPL